MKLYHRVVKLIEMQRASPQHGIRFEMQLKARWREAKGGSRRQSSEDEQNQAAAAPNHLRRFLEEYGGIGE